MKKTILSILLALSAASPVLAASVVPPGQQSEQQPEQQQQDPGFVDLTTISRMVMGPVYQAYEKSCIDGGGRWVKGDGKGLNWSCRNAAGKFGTIGLQPGQPGAPLLFLIVQEANKVTKTLRFSAYSDGQQVDVTAVKVPPKGSNNNNGAQ